MSLNELLKLLGEKNISLSLDDGQLKINAAKGVMTADIMQLLKTHKDELLATALERELRQSQNQAIPSRDKNRPIPLSFNQSRLWLLHKIAPETASYNMPMALRLTGHIDLELLQSAINKLIARHEIFSYQIYSQGEAAYQKPIALEALTLQPVPIEEKELDRLIEEEALKPFQLDTAPLLRINLWQLSAEHHVLMVNLHHIIADGLSIENLLQDLAAIYQNLATGNTAELPELNIQYADYAVWQEEQLQNGMIDSEITYWTEQLDKAPPLLNIPTKKPRNQKSSAKAKTFEHNIDSTLQTSIRRFANENNLTLYMVFLAAQQLVLGRHANQDDICIGSPIAGRHNKGTERLVGFFVNTLIFRSKIDENPRLADFLKIVQKQVLGAFDHQNAPLDMILERLDIERSPHYNPIAQVGFNFVVQSVDTEAMKKLSIDGLTIEAIEQDYSEAKYDMIWGVRDESQFNNNNLLLSIEYNCELFSEKQVTQFVKHFETLLFVFTDNLDTPVKNLPIISNSDILQLNDFNSGNYEKVTRLTPMQRDLYLDNIVSPDSKRNYLGAYHQTEQKLDKEFLQQAIDQLVANFSALRMRLLESNANELDYAYAAFLSSNSPYSKILLKTTNEKEIATDNLDRYCRSLCYQPFSLNKEALIRFFLIEQEQQDIIVISAHHCACDGVSLQLLAENLSKAYSGIANNSAINFTNDSYIEYVEPQRKRVDNQQSIQYWKQQSKNLEALSCPQPLMASTGSCDFIDDSISDSNKNLEAIKLYCSDNNIKLPIFLQAAYSLLLKAYNFQKDDFYIHEVLAARPRSHKQAIGCFFEQRPLVVSGQEPSFIRLCENLQEQRNTLGTSIALSNHEQSQLLVQGNAQYIFNYYITDKHVDFNHKDALLTIIPPEMEDAVNFMAMLDGNHFRFNLSYTSNIFNGTDFLNTFIDVCQQITHGIDDIDQLCLSKVNKENNNPLNESHYTDTVIELFEKQAAKTPDAIAAKDNNKHLTFDALNLQANHLAHRLIEQGVKPGDNVAILLPGSCDFLSAVLATLKACASYIPIDSKYPEGRISYILEDSKATTIISHSSLSDKTDTIDNVLTIDTDLSANNVTCKNLGDYSTIDSAFYSIYTSGSTGLPKGATVTQRGELNLLQWYSKEFCIDKNNVTLIISATGFDLSQKNFFAPLINGGKIIFADTEYYDSEAYIQLIQKEKVNLINCAPSAFYPLVDNAENFEKLRSLETVLFGGEAIRIQALLPWLSNPDCKAELINMYGPTECTDIATFFRVNEPEKYLHQPMPIGNPNDNIELFIADQTGHLLPKGIAGELLICGESLGLGYIDKPKLTNEVFIDHPVIGKCYRTGDLVYQNEDNDYVFIRRIDHQVKLRGLRIELGEVEYTLKTITHVNDALCLVDNDQLIAYILTHDAKPIENWQALLSKSLVEYMLPQHVIALKEWPLTANGKIDRNALPKASEIHREIVTPSSENERLLLGIWQDVLGIEKISITDNFFAIGGHSLLAVRIASRIREQFNKELAIADVFHSPSIEAIALLLDQAKEATSIDTRLREGKNSFPLSFAQQRLWFIEKLEGPSSLYTIPIALKISGPLHIKALQQAFDKLVDRHESLHLIFKEENGRAQQLIGDTYTDVLQYYVSNGDEQEITNEAASFALEPFSIGNGRLFKALCIKQESTGQYLLVLAVHHIIADGWSLDILIHDLIALYQHYAFDAEIKLPEKPIEYIDYALWQNQTFTEDYLKTHKEFWTGYLVNSELIELPCDYHRPEQLDSQGKQVPFSIKNQTANAIRKLALEEDATLFMALLAAFSVLLHKFSNQQDICIGSPIANREQAGLDQIIGLFINNIVLRNNVDGELSFTELLQHVKQSTVSVYQHQDLPFEILVDALNIDRQLNQTPLFNVMFVLQKTAQKQNITINNLAFDPVDGEAVSNTAKFDLTLNLTDSEDGLFGHFEYRTALFNEQSIENFIAAFQQLLDTLASNSSRSIKHIALFPEALPSSITDINNSWKLPQASNFIDQSPLFIDCFKQQAKQHKGKTAAWYAGKSMSYQQLDEQSNQIANYLLSTGLQTENTVSVCLNRSEQLLVVLLGILKSGAAYVPIDPAFPKERIDYIRGNACCTLNIIETEEDDKHCISLQTLLEKSKPQSKMEPDGTITANQLAYILYTSGSTGNPKGVQIEHQGLHNYLYYAANTYLTHCSHSVVSSPITFDATITSLYSPLMQGKTVIITDSNDDNFDELSDALFNSSHNSLFKITPAHLDLLAHKHLGEAPALNEHIFIIGGDQLMRQQLVNWRSLLPNCTFVNEYGPTETVVGCAVEIIKPNDEIPDDKAHIKIGKAISNTRLFVLDHHQQLLPPGAIGELYIESIGAARGYIGDTEKTNTAFIEHPFDNQTGKKLYRSGDIVRQFNDSSLEYLGRADNQVKIRGFRIELGEIESVLLKHPSIIECSALAINKTTNTQDKMLAAFFVANEPVTQQAAAIFCQQHLPSHMLPQAYTQIDTLPLTDNGKVDRKVLAQYELSLISKNTFVGAETETEKQLTAIWQDILFQDRIGVTDNFFELGGHSLLAARLTAEIRHQFNIEVSLRNIFEYPSIKALAALMEQSDLFEQAIPAIEAIDRNENLPLSFNQQRLWFVYKMAPEAGSYNMPMPIKLTGEFDLDAFNNAVNYLFSRHEILRTEIYEEGDTAYQRIITATPIQMTVEALGKDTHIESFIQAESVKPFNLSKAPLARIDIYQQQANEFILLINMHHIIGDAISLQVLVKELATAYQCFKHNLPVALNKPSIQYADFAYWQKNILQGDFLDQQLSYWHKKLQGAPALLNLPCDYPRPKKQTHHGKILSVALNTNNVARIRQFAQSSGYTPFMLLLACQQLLLGRFSSQDDICIGVPIAGRHIKDTESLVGFFINAIILRNQLHNNPSVETFLQNTRNLVLEGFAHQDAPFEKVLEQCNVTRNQSYSPIVQVGFNYVTQDESLQDISLDNLEISDLSLKETDAKYDMIWAFSDSNEGITLSIEYNTALFKEETVSHLAELYEQLMVEMLQNPETPVKKIALFNSDQLLEQLDRKPAEFDKIIPLTPMQRDLYIDSIINPDNRRNYLGWIQHADKIIDVERFQKAIDIITKQYDALRMRLHTASHPLADVAYQVILKPESKASKISIQYLDWSEENLSTEVFDQRCNELGFTPYNLHSDALIRFFIIKDSPKTSTIVLTAHHICIDGMSMQTITKAYVDLYEKLGNQEDKKFSADLYADYVKQQYLIADSHNSHLFWTEQADNVEPLKSNVSQINQQTGKYSSSEIKDSVEHKQKIEAYCEQHNSSPITYLKSLYALVLQSFTNSNADLSFNEILAARPKSHLNEVGCYFEQRPTIFRREHIQQNSFAKLIQHSEDYRKLVRGDKRLSNSLQAQIFDQGPMQAYFNFYLLPRKMDFDQGELNMHFIAPEMHDAVTLTVIIDGDSLLFTFSYTDNVFNDNRFIERFLHISNQILDGTDTISALDMRLPDETPAAEKEPVNASHKSVIEWIEQQVAKTPDAIAIKGKDNISYRELDNKAKQLANHLYNNFNIEPGDHIALCLPPGSEFLSALLAALKLGACYIPIDNQYPSGRINYIVEDSNAKSLICHSSLLQKLDSETENIVCLDRIKESLESQPAEFTTVNTEIDDGLYLIYTSGSTGLPKAAKVKQRGELNLLNWYSNEFSFTTTDNTLVISATGFDLTQKNLFVPLITGGSVSFIETESFEPLAIIEQIKRLQITNLNAAPSAFYALLEECNHFEQLASLRLVLFGGEAIDMKQLMPWLESSSCSTKIVNMYGPTECTDIASFYRIEEPARFVNEVMPIGKANDNVSLYLADDSLRLLPQGFSGELLVGGEGVGLGYYHRDELNKEAFINHPIAGNVYRTGDRVKQLDDGNYVFVSRIDHQVKIRGLRIELGEIEYALRSIAHVADALVTVHNDKLVAFVTSNQDNISWREPLQEQLPAYMLPQQLVILESWPLTANGKIDRKALPFDDNTQKIIVPPRTATEEKLFDIFSDVLATDQISIDDSFFDMGGHSLLAARAVSRIRDTFGQDLPIREVFFSPTISAIADILDKAEHQHFLPSLDLVDRDIYHGQFPLSHAQQRLYLIEQIQGASTMYNIPLLAKLSGDIDIAAFQKALNATVSQYEALRSRMGEKDVKGQLMPYQYLSSEAFELQINPADNEEQLQQMVLQALAKPFTLLNAPLFSAELFTLGKHQSVLLLNQHHLISDGLSSQILLQTLAGFYQEACNGNTPNINVLHSEYIDYSIWQKLPAMQERLDTQLEYWKQQLKQAPLLQLPFDSTPQAGASAEGKLLNFKLSHETSTKVEQIAQAQQTTPFTVLLAAFKTLLFRYSGQTDINIGTAVANRPLTQFENTLGYFINTLVLRSDIDNDIRFTQLINQLSNTHSTALSNQDLPFEALLDELGLNRDLSHSPVFQAFFNYQQLDDTPQEMTLAGTHFSSFDIADDAPRAAKFELSLSVSNTQEGISGNFEYRTALFKSETIKQFSQHFVALLDSISHSPDSLIGELQFISDAEKQQQLNFDHGFNATAHKYPDCKAIHHLIEQQAAKTPLAIALKDDKHALSYQQLNEKANQLARLLIRKGVKPGDAVAVCYERSVYLSVSLLAVLKAGAAYVPFDPAFPIERLQFMQLDTGLTLLLTQQHLSIAESIQHVDVLNSDDESLYKSLTSNNIELDITDDAVFNIIYTSGSTGKPKGVLVPHKGIINRLRWMQFKYPIDNLDTVLQKTPYSFDVSVWELFWPLMQGSKLVYAKAEGHKDPDYLRQIIQQENITTLHFVPSMLHVFLQTADIEQCSSIKQVFCSGEALQVTHSQTFFERLGFSGLHNLYGPTEASIDASWFDCTKDDSYACVPIGKPIHNTQLHILDTNLNVLPLGIAGELYIGGEGLALGYLNRDDLTATTFIDNPYYPLGHPSKKLYKTGDLARLLPDGNIEYLGRTDHQVKIRGLRIELGEIEAALLTHKTITETLVITKTIAHDNALVAYLTSDATPIIAELKKSLSQILPDYMIPQYFVLLDHFPLNANGKIDRKVLPEPQTEIRNKAIIEAKNSIEEKLLALWQQGLKTDDISCDDNFFRIGGHSLKAAELANHIRSTFSVDISLRDLFDATDIIHQALLIEQRQSSVQRIPDITPCDRTQALLPSYAQQRLWFLAQMMPDSPAYNIPISLKLEGNINIKAFEQSFDDLFERHEILRSYFVTEDGEPTIKVNEQQVFSLTETLVTKESELLDVIQTLSITPFSLSEGKLLRADLVTLANDYSVLVINMHHIISDGSSLQILLRELGMLYLKHAKGQPLHLPELDVQYIDYAMWQRNWLQGEVLEQQLDFWRTTLNGAPELLRLPTDRPRPDIQSFKGAVYKTEVSGELLQSLRGLANKESATLFMTLLAAYQVLLYKYSDQEDICVGIPLAGRSTPGVENLIGFFINALIIRSDLSANLSVSELIQQIRENTLAAFAHEHVPIEMLLNEMNFSRNLSYTPIVQCAFNMITGQDALIPESLSNVLDDLSIGLIESDQTVAKFDLQFSVIDTQDALNIGIEYSTDLFDSSTIETMASLYIEILQLFSGSPEIHLDEIQLGRKQSGGDREKSVALTSTCRDIYLSSIADPDTLQNSTGYAIEIPMAINEKLWQQAVTDVCIESDMLNSTVKSNHNSYSDNAYFLINAQRDIAFTFLDYSNRTISNEALQEKLKSLTVHPYDIHSDNLYSQTLIKLSDNHYWISYGVHHILSDGFACALHINYCLKRYEQLLTGDNSPLQIEDNFVTHSYQSLRHFNNKTTLDYWRKNLSQVEGFSAEPAKVQEERLLQLPVDPVHYKTIRQYCKQYAITPAIYFKAIFALLVQQYQRSNHDFIFNESNAGRSKDNRSSIGCFYHNQPFLIQSDALSSTIDALFKSFKQQQKTSRNYLEISNLMLRKLLPQTQLQFSYNYLAIPHNYDFLNATVKTTRYTPNAQGMVDFRVQADNDEIILSLAYHSSLFDDRKLLQRALNISEQFLSGNISHTSQIEYRLNDDISPLSNIDYQPLPLLPAMLQKQSMKYPSATAVICGEQALSYTELEIRSNALANHLIESGCEPQDRVAICLGNRVELIIVLIAAIKANACYIPVDISYPDERIEYMLNDSQAKFIISEDRQSERLSSISHQANVCNIDTIDFVQLQLTRPLREIADNDLIYMIYTSGSTGLPKAASVYHYSEASLIDWYKREFNFGPDDKTLIISAVGFDLTQKNFYTLLCSGGTVVLNDAEFYDPGSIANLIDQHRISYINCAPSAFYPLIEQQHSNKLGSLKQVFFGGESIQLNRLSSWINQANFECSIINMYGPTECTDISTFHTLTTPELKQAADNENFRFPLGSASQGVELYVVNDQLQQQPLGFIGELCIGGLSLGNGYWQRPELTTETFVANPYSSNQHNTLLYKTGDLVEFHKDDQGHWLLYYVGRKDFQVKLNGLRIELGEIEQALRHIPGVDDALVTVDNDQLLAFALSPHNEIHAWRETLEQTLPAYMVPPQLQLLQQWPLTANGKIDRKALLAMERKHALGAEIMAPRNNTEKELSALWKEVLGVGDIGIHDNFFTSGGDSLAAVRLIGRIEVRFEIKLPVASLFGAQTIAQLAHEIHQQTHQWTPIVPIQGQGSKTPIFAIHALGGMVISYEPLSRLLGTDQPFYGVQAYGFEEEQTPFTELHEMVEYYTLAIIDTQAEGPFQIIGHSFGGVIAIEVARNLINKGHQVNFVGLIDTHMPIRYMSIPLDDAGILQTFAEHNFGETNMPLKTLRLLPPEKMVSLVVDKLGGIVSKDFLYSAIAIIRGFQRMMMNFHNKPLDIPLYLYRPENEKLSAVGKLKRRMLGEKGKTLGWHKVSKDLTLYESPGDHFSMLKEDNVAPLCQQVRSSLNNHQLIDKPDDKA